MNSKVPNFYGLMMVFKDFQALEKAKTKFKAFSRFIRLSANPELQYAGFVQVYQTECKPRTAENKHKVEMSPIRLPHAVHGTCSGYLWTCKMSNQTTT